MPIPPFGHNALDPDLLSSQDRADEIRQIFASGRRRVSSGQQSPAVLRRRDPEPNSKAALAASVNTISDLPRLRSDISKMPPLLHSSTARLTQEELACHWRISPRTLEGWRSNGVGPQYLKIGGRILYRLEDIKSYEIERKCSPT